MKINNTRARHFFNLQRTGNKKKIYVALIGIVGRSVLYKNSFDAQINTVKYS